MFAIFFAICSLLFDNYFVYLHYAKSLFALSEIQGGGNSLYNN